MQKWEYFVAPLLPHNPGEILNGFGEDGWELVNVLSQPTPAPWAWMPAHMISAWQTSTVPTARGLHTIRPARVTR